MSITTLSAFYFGYVVDENNYQLDFKEGGGQLTAEIAFGDYTLTQFVSAVQDALNAAGALTYTVSVARSSRHVTIAAGSNFSLLVSTGTHGAEIYDLLGFSGSDKTGNHTYTGSAGSGSAYYPQFTLQSYLPPANYSQRKNVTVQETATGMVEVVSFGDNDMIEMDIRFSTNIHQGSLSPIANNSTGVEDLNTFMRALITKAPVEFMPDKNNTSTFYSIILDSTQIDPKGCGYKLKERFDILIPGYFDTDRLVFRVVDL